MRLKVKMKTGLLILVFLVGFLPVMAQVTDISLSIPRDSAGFPGDIVRMPVMLNTDLTTENIIAFRLEFNPDAQLKPLAIIKAASLISGWGDPLFNYNASNNQFSVTGAGISSISGTGVLFYIDFELQPTNVTYPMNPVIYLNTSGANNYFNEGAYTITMDYGQITINPIPVLSVNVYNTPLTRGDSTQIYVSGGTSPYTFTVSDPALATINGGNYLKALMPGMVTVQASDVNGVTGVSSQVEIRGYRLSFSAPDGTMAGDTVEVILTTTGLNSLNILSGTFEINLSNNAELLETVQSGTLLEGYSLEQNAINATKYLYAFAGSSVLSDGNALLKLRLKIKESENSGYVSLWVRNMMFNEDLPGNYQDYSFYYLGLPKPSIGGGGNNLIPGETALYSASGGTPPYTWTVSNSGLASINNNGLMTVLKGGVIKVIVTDSLAQITETNDITLLDGQLTVPDEVGILGQQHDLPVYITAMPAGREWSAYSFTIQLDTTYLDFVDIIKAGTLSNDFNIVSNNADKRYVKIAAASQTAIGNAGILMYIKLQLKPAMLIDYTSNVYLNDVLFNEGVPSLRIDDGSVKAGDPPPLAADTLVDINEDTSYVFISDVFNYSQVQSKPLASVLIASLPTVGSLVYNGSPMTSPATVPVSNFGLLSFRPALNQNGSPYSSFIFRVFDGSNYSNNFYTFTFNVIPVNDPPAFSISSAGAVRDQDFTDTITVVSTPAAVPSDELAQTVTYSLTPPSVTFAGISFDTADGTLKISGVPGAYGSQSFTITANDGQPENNLYQQSFLLTIDKVNYPPQISNQVFSIAENSSFGTAVGTILANDPNGDTLVFAVISGNTNNVFLMDSITGALTVNNPAELDFETTPVFVLGVSVTDGLVASSANITVNLTDVVETNAPVISDQSFTVAENSIAGAIVGTVVASDPNRDTLRYAIDAGNTNNAFAIDSATGVLTVYNPAALDFQTKPEFILVVSVSDRTLTAYANVTVNLTLKLSQTITFDALSTKTFGDADFSLGATASSGLGVSYSSSNTAVATVSGNTVTIGGAGSTTITASQAGDATYAPAPEVLQVLTVNKADQTITFNALPAKALGNAPFTLDATSSSGLAVSYSSDNAAVATMSGNTVTVTGVGSAVITASQAGNNNYYAAPDVQQTLAIGKSGQTITFDVITDQQDNGGTINLSATASSGLTVSFEVSGPAALNGTILTLTGAGKVTVTASQAGNITYAAADPVINDFCVNPLPVITQQAGTTAQFALASNYTTGNQWLEDGANISGATSSTYEVAHSGTYGLKVTIDGCTGISENMTVVLTSIDDPSSSGGLSLYPNPVTSTVYIHGLNKDDRMIRVISTDGKILKDIRLMVPAKSMEINVSDLSPDVYIIHVSGGKVGRMVKMIRW